MIKVSALRELREARIQEARDVRTGSAIFVQELREKLLGITEDNFGRRMIAPNSAQPEELSIRHLAESIMGHDWIEDNWNPRSGQSVASLLEAGPGIDPTTFLNINVFSAAVGGLVDAKIIERFNNPMFIGDQLMSVRPTKLNGEKIIGVTGIGDKGQSRKPGEPHPRAAFGEQWVSTPELDEKALAVEVLQETVFYDLTGQVLDVAGSVGDELGYLKEKTQIDLAIGVTNSYSYKGTTYNTYQTATPWINKFQNVLDDYSDIDNVLQKFNQMSDPATGKEILVMPNTLLVHSQRTMKVDTVLHATEIRNTTNTNTITLAQNPIKSKFAVLSSPILDNRITGSGGLNLGTTNGPNNWWAGDYKKAFAWMEAWPLRVRQASASEFVMLDRGLIAAYFANWRGVGAVIEPRYSVQSTH